MKDLFRKAARGEPTERPPVWMMRQAGRYLPEYRELREDYSFLEAISTPEVAAEITLQPWERFRPDAVVMYSDILTVLEPLGFSYHLESGVGPVVENPVEAPADTRRERGDVREQLWYVGDLLERLTDELGEQAATLGFAGGPFTLAAYVCEGTPSRSFMAVRRLRAEHPEAFERLLEAFTDVLVEYVEFQVESGADAVQLFDTYAGLLSPADYREFLLPLHREVLEAVDVPTIVFARNVSGNLDLLADSGADVVGLDWTVDLESAHEQLADEDVAIQGNLDPALLYGDPETVRDRTRDVIDAVGDAGHILNLGHGVDRNTPVENVEAFFETAKTVE
ncbi:uroporphyrinogen decarboxylase [Halobiforma lacisalsi AJ5]|uniref:Uroporphyrinogen decarboxylase n=1 Tax=Natronobacterium lacisalsi AJ5 TaxID=358396 RepID=M0LG28_NATLA|nr:uroporphyrinogen decarboxylase [Halobiforma lacisalsi]APW98681.1 uroporphyrinogen decarboxylase [Halobiforma lacisalsi AJ5]EMA32552.1 Uroporphyrinogen decarboxylase [Halobiforma lacisalsi AJ5]